MHEIEVGIMTKRNLTWVYMYMYLRTRREGEGNGLKSVKERENCKRRVERQRENKLGTIYTMYIHVAIMLLWPHLQMSPLSQAVIQSDLSCSPSQSEPSTLQFCFS